MARSVFHVTVFCVDGRKEHYIFSNLTDVQKSVELTYSGLPFSQRAKLMGETAFRWEFGTGLPDQPIIVCVQRSTIDGPTHL